MQFVRAPDENVYIAPFNLIEIVISALFEWWLNKKAYEFINDCVMGFLYSPLLLITAFFETRTAYAIRRNRARGEEDDDIVEEWEQLAHEIDFGDEGWAKKCEAVKPNLEVDPAVVEIKKLRGEIAQLRSMLSDISDHVQYPTSQDTKIGDGSTHDDFKTSYFESTHEESDHAGKTAKDAGHEHTSTLSDTREEAGQSSSGQLIETADDYAKPVKPSEELAQLTVEPTHPATHSSEAAPEAEPEAEPEVEEETQDAPSKTDGSKAPEDIPFKASEDTAFESSEDAPFKTPDDLPSEAPEAKPFQAPEDASLETPEYVPFAAPEDLPAETLEGASSKAPEAVSSKAPEDETSDAPEDVTPKPSEENDPFETPGDTSSKAPEATTPEPLARADTDELEAEDPNADSPTSGGGGAEGQPSQGGKKRRRRKKNKGAQGGPSGGS
jgi:hypothetical protein